MRSRLRVWVLRACGALLRPCARPAPAPGGMRRILIIRPDQLGDVLLSLPVIDALAQALPAAHLTLAVAPWGRPALGETMNKEVLLCPFPGFSRTRMGPLQPYLLLLRYGLRLRRQRAHDMAVVLRPDHWWGAFLVCLAGIPVRVGYATPESTPFLTQTLPFTLGRHAVVDALDLATVAAHLGSGLPLPAPFAAISSLQLPMAPQVPSPPTKVASYNSDRSRRVSARGTHANGSGTAMRDPQADVWSQVERLPFSPPAPAIAPLPCLARDVDQAVVRDLLQNAGVTGDEALLVLHPGSNSPLKAWPLERFAAVGLQLAGDLAARIAVTGSRGERNLAQQLCDLLPAGTLNLAGRLIWTELEALLARATLVVGVDSGPLHLAVAAGTPSVVLFGPADPVQFGPWGSPARHRVVTADLPCRPCRRLDLCALDPGGEGPPPCMRAIDPDPVLNAARSVLAAGRRGVATLHQE